MTPPTTPGARPHDFASAGDGDPDGSAVKAADGIAMAGPIMRQVIKL